MIDFMLHLRDCYFALFPTAGRIMTTNGTMRLKFGTLLLLQLHILLVMKS